MVSPTSSFRLLSDFRPAGADPSAVCAAAADGAGGARRTKGGSGVTLMRSSRFRPLTWSLRLRVFVYLAIFGQNRPKSAKIGRYGCRRRARGRQTSNKGWFSGIWHTRFTIRTSNMVSSTSRLPVLSDFRPAGADPSAVCAAAVDGAGGAGRT